MTMMFDCTICRLKTTTLKDTNIPLPLYIFLLNPRRSPRTIPPILLTAVIGAREWASDRAVFVRVINADHGGPSTRDNNENAQDDEENVEGDERFKAQGFICFAMTPVIMQPHPAFCDETKERAQSCTDETDKISKKWNC